MKFYLYNIILHSVSGLLLFSCQKDENPDTVLIPDAVSIVDSSKLSGTPACIERQVINVRMVPFGMLSTGRVRVAAATAGTKIVFAGGWEGTKHSSRVDIYDTLTKAWSTAELTEAQRDGMAVATLGSKIFFAGGGNFDWIDLTSRVDIYDATNNTWSTAELSKARSSLAAVSIGEKIFFAGGGTWDQPYYTGSEIVDIYDNSTNSWSVAKLSIGRYELTATRAGNKLYFAGGLYSIFEISDQIDVFDATNNDWSIDKLSYHRTGHSSVATDDKIFWAAGATTPYSSGYQLVSSIEIQDLKTGTISHSCISPNRNPPIVKTSDHIIFFTGGDNNFPGNGWHIDIYNIREDKWYRGVLDKKIIDACVVAVGNSVFVAGGRSAAGSAFKNEVWKLEF